MIYMTIDLAPRTTMLPRVELVENEASYSLTLRLRGNDVFVLDGSLDELWSLARDIEAVLQDVERPLIGQELLDAEADELYELAL